MGKNSVNDFVLPEEKTVPLKENLERVCLLFNVDVELTTNDPTSGKQWVQLKGIEKDIEKARDYINAMCNPELVQTIKLPLGLFDELRTDEKRLELEKNYCVVVTIGEPDTLSLDVHGTLISVTMAVSDMEARIRVFSEQPNPDTVATTDGHSDTNVESISAVAAVSPNAWSDSNREIRTEHQNHGQIESATDIPPSMREFARKLNYADHDIDAVVKTFGPEITINELLQELVKNSASSRQSGCNSEETTQLPVSRSCASTSTFAEERRWLIARGTPTMRTWMPETKAEFQADVYRPIVIDGSNVAMNHGNQEVFSCRGILICVEYFERRGHQDITVFVPMWRKEEPRPGSPIENQEVLYELSRRNILKFTPSRSTGNRRIVCYDDKYIVNLAEQNGGIIVSNDNFRDLLKENPRWKEAIEERTLMYTFVGDRFMPPDDPLGRRGPCLDDFLRKGTSTHPRICPYQKNCTYGHRCKYYHPERDAKRQQGTSNTPPENSARCISTADHGVTTSSIINCRSHAACHSRLISTKSNHQTVGGEHWPPTSRYFQTHNTLENPRRRPDNIAVRGRDTQPRGIEQNISNNRFYQQQLGGGTYPDYRHTVRHGYDPNPPLYRSPVPSAMYHPDMRPYHQTQPQWPRYAPPVSYAPNRNTQGFVPSVMGLGAFAYYEPAPIPNGNLRGREASRDHLDGSRDKEMGFPVSEEILDSLVEKLKDIFSREVIVRVLQNHPRDCETGDLDVLAGLVLDATS